MKLLKSFITLFVVIVIGILVYFFVYKAEELRKIREAEARQLIRFDLNHINSFTIARPESSIVFERGIGRIWNITAPIKSEAEKEELQNLFSSLDESKILYTADEKPDNIKIYGLEKPEYYLAMKYDMSNPDTLFLGNPTPDGSMAYVKFASEDRILTINRELTNKLKWPARSYRSRTILNTIASDITGIEIIKENNDKIILVNTGSNWVMQHPWKLNGDEKNIESLTDGISKTAKTTLIEEKTDDLSQYGLDNPSLVFNVSLKYGMPEKMILVGKRWDIGNRQLWAAKQFDQDLIFAFESSLVNKLTRKPEWFIDKSPMKFNIESINRIILETGNNSITFVKDAQKNWSVVSPIDKNLEFETINKILSCTFYVFIRDLFAYEPTEKDIIIAGLDKPNIKISIYENDNMIDQIVFGNTFTTDETNTYFRTSKSSIIYITRASISSDINIILNDVFGV